MSLRTISLWLFLAVKYVSGEDLSFAERTYNVSSISVVNATRKSLTVAAEIESSERCTYKNIVWNFAKGDGVFTRAKHKRLFHRVTGTSITYHAEISHLMPGTEYRITVAIEDCHGFIKKNILATTCPDVPQNVSLVKVDNVQYDFFTIVWKAPNVTCASTSYYILVYEYQEDVNYITRKCPHEESLIQKNSLFRCGDQHDHLCYPWKVPDCRSTQFIVLVVTTDSSRKCSAGSPAFVKFSRGATLLSEFQECMKTISQYSYGFWVFVLILGFLEAFARKRCSRRHISENDSMDSREGQYEETQV